MDTTTIIIKDSGVIRQSVNPRVDVTKRTSYRNLLCVFNLISFKMVQNINFIMVSLVRDKQELDLLNPEPLMPNNKRRTSSLGHARSLSIMPRSENEPPYRQPVLSYI